ncbi:hypothetical protein NEMBOFW57_001442 [Staphylotrichum longicolle]|uniref:Uncharacterized protein n=1 Tax=Staphylotrichum longicolle TaxID=669026 RepID=A0AAD4I3S3_9PEZI|nr:hypothetical protein NEMBOFW57_001442 [Staphylotrichum longicolle]
MCHVCDRLEIDIELPSEEHLAKEAAEARLVAQGQKPPRPGKTPLPRTKVVVEPAPSHDGAPTYAAYEMQLALLAADPDSPDGYSNSPPSQDAEKYRPPFGIRIYDTTPRATGGRAALLARRISELTYRQRVSDDYFRYKDRIEVVALPLPEATTRKDRMTRCVAHNDAEREARLLIADPALAASWFIVEDFDADFTRKRVFVINDLQDSWEEALSTYDYQYADSRSPHGHFFDFAYDCTSSSDNEEIERSLEEEPFVAGLRCRGEERLENLGTHLMYFRDNVVEFYVSHFIPEGVLEMELALARAEAAGTQVPRPVVIPLRTSHGHC